MWRSEGIASDGRLGFISSLIQSGGAPKSTTLSKQDKDRSSQIEFSTHKYDPDRRVCNAVNPSPDLSRSLLLQLFPNIASSELLRAPARSRVNTSPKTTTPP